MQVTSFVQIPVLL